MTERKEMVEELKHLVRYYSQAAHEFFDDADGELQERLETIYACLEKDQNSLSDYKKMIEFVTAIESQLKKKVDDLSILSDRMIKLLQGE